jgi:formylglycine-generating enzyme required for sulfatase activity
MINYKIRSGSWMNDDVICQTFIWSFDESDFQSFHMGFRLIKTIKK